MNVIQDNPAGNKHPEGRKDDVITKRPVMGAPTQPITRVNQRLAVSASAIKTPSTAGRKPILGSAAMKSVSSRVTDSSQVVLAICEGRGQARGIVGIAAMDINKPVLVLCQISDTQTYTNTLTKVNILRPVEVIIPSSLVESTTPSRIFTLLKNQFPNLTVSSVSRAAFRSSRGLSYVTSLCAPEFKSVTLVIREKFYALASASALIKYIQKEQNIMYPTRSIKIEYQEPEDTAVIDIDSADRLELVTSSNHEERGINLLSMLDHCVTGVGRKMLRATILQPPCIDHVIQARVDCVQELLENTEFRIKLKGVLANLHNIECALLFGAMVPQSPAAVSDKQLNYTLQLKTLVANIAPLRTELEGAHHPLFRRIHEQLVQAPYAWLLKKLHKVLTEEAHPATGHAGDLQRCFAIRTGLNGFLDIARRTYMEVIDDMRAYVQNLSDKYSLPLRIHHTLKRGFHIVLNLTGSLRNMEKSSLPSVFVKVEKNTTHFIMTTSDMTNFGVRLQTNCQEIESISNVIIYQLLANIRQCIGHLYRLCDDVALLDVLQSLATVSATAGYIRPQFSAEHMEIIGARHPLLEYSCAQEPVPNNIVASNLYNLHVVTGPNMSGKSIYVRQMPLLQVLAQIGCYVPAQTAVFRSCTHVYARITVEDALHDNSSSTTSTFVREMTEVQYMLNTVGTGSRSLIVLDELCHSTSVDEGVSIAVAICEHLLKTKAYIFVATHFLSMTKLADLYYSVSNSHLESVESVRDSRRYLKFTHRLIAGINGVETYGIKLSRICGGSDLVSDRAEEILHDLLPTQKTIQPSTHPQNITYLKYRLYADLKLLQLQNKLTPAAERKRLDEYETLTGDHYEIGQVLSVDQAPSRTSSSRGSRTTKSSSTADASDRQRSEPSTSIYDRIRGKCKPGAFDKANTESTSSKIVDGLIPSDEDFLYCITADSPTLDSDPLGVSVKPVESQSDSDVDEVMLDVPAGTSLYDDLESPTYSPNFDLLNETFSPHTPDSDASVDIMPIDLPLSPNLTSMEQNSQLPQRLETNSLTSPSFEPMNPVTSPNVPFPNPFEFLHLPSDSTDFPSFPLNLADPFQTEPLDLRKPELPIPVNPVPENSFSFTPRVTSESDSGRTGSLQYTETETQYMSETRYESMDCYGPDWHASVTVSTYYSVSNVCITESSCQEQTVREEAHYNSYQELASHAYGSHSSGSHQCTASIWPERSNNSNAQGSDRYQTDNVYPSTSGYQSNVWPNQQTTHPTVQRSNANDAAYPSTSAYQPEPQQMPKSRSTTLKNSSDAKVPKRKHTYQSKVCPNHQPSCTTVHGTRTNDMVYPSTSSKPSKNTVTTGQDSYGGQKQEQTVESTEKKTDTDKPFIFKPVLPARKSVSFNFSTIDPASFLELANTKTESVPANSDFKFEHRIEPRRKPEKYLFFNDTEDKSTPKTFEINLKPSVLKTSADDLETQPGTSRSQRTQTKPSVSKRSRKDLETQPGTLRSQTSETDSTEHTVPKRAHSNKSNKSKSHDGFHTLYDLFLTDYESEQKKIEEVLKDDDDEEVLRNLRLDQTCVNPTPVPETQRPREGWLSDIVNPKKGKERKSRSDKGIKNMLPLERFKQPANTRTKRVLSPVKHERKTANQQSTVSAPYLRAGPAKITKLSSVKTPCQLEEPTSKRKIEKSQRKSVKSRQKGKDNSNTERQLTWSEILNEPPPKLVDYKDSVISGIELMEETMSSHETTVNSVQHEEDTVFDTSRILQRGNNGNESISSLVSENMFANYLNRSGITSTPLEAKSSPTCKSKPNKFHRTLSEQESENTLIGSSDDSLNYTLDVDLNLHYKPKVGDACPKIPMPKQETSVGSCKTCRGKTGSLRTTNKKQGSSSSKVQQHGHRQPQNNEQLVVDETQLSAASSQGLSGKSQTILRPPKLTFQCQHQSLIPSTDNNENAINKPETFTTSQHKPKLSTKKETNSKLGRHQSNKNTKVIGQARGKGKMTQAEDKSSEELAYNKLETVVMAPLRSKRQKEMDNFFEDVKRLRINLDTTSKQPDSEYANIQYCPSKKQLSKVECVAVGQRDTAGEMTVTMNAPRPTVATTPSVDNIIQKYMAKPAVQKYPNAGN